VSYFEGVLHFDFHLGGISSRAFCLGGIMTGNHFMLLQ